MADGATPLRKPLILSLALVAAMAAVSLYGWIAIPSGARIAIHWGLEGAPDGFAGKGLALSVMPAIALLISAALALVPRIDPRRSNLLQSSKAYGAVWVSVVGLLALVHAAIVANALGFTFEMTTLIGLGIGLLFMILGNFLGKVRSNFFFGIRTPWTLSSDRVWDRTHRTAGPLFILLGLAICLAAVFLSPRAFFVLLLAGVVAVTVFVLAYSYVLWRQEQRNAHPG